MAVPAAAAAPGPIWGRRGRCTTARPIAQPGPPHATFVRAGGGTHGDRDTAAPPPPSPPDPGGAAPAAPGGTHGGSDPRGAMGGTRPPPRGAGGGVSPPCGGAGGGEGGVSPPCGVAGEGSPPPRGARGCSGGGRLGGLAPSQPLPSRPPRPPPVLGRAVPPPRCLLWPRSARGRLRAGGGVCGVMPPHGGGGYGPGGVGGGTSPTCCPIAGGGHPCVGANLPSGGGGGRLTPPLPVRTSLTQCRGSVPGRCPEVPGSCRRCHGLGGPGTAWGGPTAPRGARGVSSSTAAARPPHDPPPPTPRTPPGCALRPPVNAVPRGAVGLPPTRPPPWSGSAVGGAEYFQNTFILYIQFVSVRRQPHTAPPWGRQARAVAPRPGERGGGARAVGPAWGSPQGSGTLRPTATPRPAAPPAPRAPTRLGDPRQPRQWGCQPRRGAGEGSAAPRQPPPRPDPSSPPLGARPPPAIKCT